jgi:hypothetical protein
MSLSVPYHFTTAASTNLLPIGSADQGGNLKGFSVANVATAIYIKLYWSNTIPTVGTTVPNMTIGVLASVNVYQAFPDGVTGNGQMWVAVTGAAADSDSSVAAAGAVITLLVE